MAMFILSLTVFQVIVQKLELSDRSVKIPPKIYVGDTINIPDHGFITGESVNYTPDKELIEGSELEDDDIALFGEE